MHVCMRAFIQVTVNALAANGVMTVLTVITVGTVIFRMFILDIISYIHVSSQYR